jgi:hypothetical protein
VTHGVNRPRFTTPEAVARDGAAATAVSAGAAARVAVQGQKKAARASRTASELVGDPGIEPVTSSDLLGVNWANVSGPAAAIGKGLGRKLLFSTVESG